MITGYNTDIEYDGIVYHIQTEDKGVEHPIILSLVYVDGAILASKRSPYDDLIAGGFDTEILTRRLQRQHKLICAAVRAGRIEDLKRLGQDGSKVQSPPAPKPAEHAARQAREPNKADLAELPVPKPDPEDYASDTAASAAADEALQIKLLPEPELHAGESVTLRVLVTRAAQNAREPVPKARVTLKTLGSTFRPESKHAKTDGKGIAMFVVLLPKFNTGRAAILIRAEADGEVAELRRIILPG
ncbi:MAG TPA: hypothetical protein VEM96_13050 [Pyrinomonadaceae bacterium]|nr:hypothetical protein [Pyrinomonadaceae bacterium]